MWPDISELISNSLKYAFPNEMKGEIYVSLKSVADNYQLIINDNGMGLSEEIDFNNPKTLGLLLVNSLTEQSMVNSQSTEATEQNSR